MPNKTRLDAVFAPSPDVVAREIEGEMIIVPITAGIGGIEDALFTLNETGREIWVRLDGKCSLKDIVVELAADYDAGVDEIGVDVLGLVEELTARGMLVRK